MNSKNVPFRHALRIVATGLAAFSCLSGSPAAQQRASFSGVVGAADRTIVTFTGTALLPVPSSLRGDLRVVRQGYPDAMAQIVRLPADPNRYARIAVAGQAERVRLCARPRCAGFHIVRVD